DGLGDRRGELEAEVTEVAGRVGEGEVVGGEEGGEEAPVGLAGLLPPALPFGDHGGVDADVLVVLLPRHAGQLGGELLLRQAPAEAVLAKLFIPGWHRRDLSQTSTNLGPAGASQADLLGETSLAEDTPSRSRREPRMRHAGDGRTFIVGAAVLMAGLVIVTMLTINAKLENALAPRASSRGDPSLKVVPLTPAPPLQVIAAPSVASVTATVAGDPLPDPGATLPAPVV